ncbi:response regulator [Dechloromonas agitata]|uniref:response regulator transcription factor n=1 Tax=Dechloromonas agitata TaxID=73030 RepID=UPI0004825F55|nr:response regulator [Dechloromonas agitata]MDE1543823.1 response regulator [Dechloromonas agitata]
MSDNLTVFIVDDDPSVRDALSLLLGVEDYRVAVFGDAESFLKAYKKTWRGCLLLDIRMPGMDGLTLQKHLNQLGSDLPVIVMTGHGDVASAREAFRALAVDFLEKPLDHRKLLAAIADAFARQQSQLAADLNRSAVERLLAGLTPREREVMARVVAGQHNRDIAAELGISPRTVEVHKARMMDKLGVGNVADLVRLNLELRA